MTQRDDNISLRQMLDHSTEAVNLLQGKNRADLERDRVLELALVRLLEIAGEAANRVSQTKQEELPSIPWSQIIGLRNRLIHGYDAIDLDVLWEILSSDLPLLTKELQAALDL